MSAHFKSYLASRYPDTASEFEIHVQTGGLVNHTVRARRGSQSFILKYAPPYIAVLGESAPFSQERQAVEAASLKLFEQGPLSTIPTNNQIAIPKVLDHDRDGFILALEDLGQLDTLWNSLRSAPIATDKETLNAKYADIGKRIGGFFAAMHLPSTLASIKDLVSQNQEFRVLDQNLTRDTVLEGVLMPVLRRLQQPGGMEHDEAQRLYSRILEDFERPALPDENCFSMGDCHPGSFLLPKPGDGKVAIIDFEFATIQGGRGVNGDMAQLLASLHVLLLSLRPGSPAYLATEAFVSALCKAYSENAWMSLGRKATDSERTSRMAIFRSSLILHGREVINHAVDLEWASEAMSVAEMVQVGVWYLERAGANVDDMMRADNWAELEAKEDRKIMLRLWGLC